MLIWKFSYLSVRWEGGFESIPQADEFPSFLVLPYLDISQLTHKLVYVTVEMLDRLQTILEIAAKGTPDSVTGGSCW